MPRCEGLPSGPCPRSRNDRTVTHTGCDLFLCKDCYDIRCPVIRSNSSDLTTSYQDSGNSLASAEVNSTRPGNSTKGGKKYKGCGEVTSVKSVVREHVQVRRVVDENSGGIGTDLGGGVVIANYNGGDDDVLQSSTRRPNLIATESSAKSCRR